MSRSKKIICKKGFFCHANKILTQFQQQIPNFPTEFPDWSREIQEVKQLREEIEQLRQEIQELRTHSERKPEQPKNETITELENRIVKREAEIQKINASSQDKDQETNTFLPKNFLGGVEQQMADLAQRMEKIDQQNQTNKWSGRTVNLIAISCLLGGGLISFLALLFCLSQEKRLIIG
jgi:hypothetical protein